MQRRPVRSRIGFLGNGVGGQPAVYDASERLQRFDAALVEVSRDVPVPDGLANRLLERLKQAQTERIAPDDPENVERSAEKPAAFPARHRVSRRWCSPASGVVAAAAVLVVGLCYWPYPGL